MPKIEITKIIRSKRRTVALVISAEATLVVRAPMRTPLSLIEDLVAEKSKWICDKMQEISSRPISTKKNFSEGEDFLYLGMKCRLKLNDSLEIKISESGELLFPRIFLWRAKARLLDWYKKQAYKEITQKVEIISRKLNLKYSSIKISSAQRNWGSCGPKNSLNFNWRLIMAPGGIIDYVIIHELMHIVEKNHSQKFWNRVSGVMPEYKNAKKWLRDNGRLLTLE